MWYTIRKWWFLQRIEDAIKRHTLINDSENMSYGEKVLLDRKFLIEGNKVYRGIIHISVNRLRWVLLWKLLRRDRRLSERIYEYSNFYDYLVDKDIGYIKEETALAQPMPTLTIKGQKAHGVFGLAEMLLQEYPLTWDTMGRFFAVSVAAIAASSILADIGIRALRYVEPHAFLLIKKII